MKNIRERIRINGKPISEVLFASRFFEIWKVLPREPKVELDVPRYLQLLTLLAIHVFIAEEVDVAIFETHCGGEYDATNIIRAPLVTAVTSIGKDHVRLLGPEIENIAWHKAGIFKQGCLAFSTLQDPEFPEVTAMLKKRAYEKGAVLSFVDIEPTLPTDAGALKPEVQRINCSLALAVVQAWMSRQNSGLQINRQDILRAIEKFSWPGRFQQINGGSCHWFLDCAHNELSLPHAVAWYSETIKKGLK
jgi:folylpolyglutamate synthase